MGTVIPGKSAGAGLLETLLAGGTVTAAGTVNCTPVTGLGCWKQATVELIFTDVDKDAGDTLDVYIDTSFDGGGTRVNAIHFPQIAGNTANAQSFVGVLDPGGAPGTATIATTADANAGVTRPALFGDRLRVRHVLVQDGDEVADGTFTFSVVALFK